MYVQVVISIIWILDYMNVESDLHEEEREAAEDDLAANCFVCNLDRFQVRHLHSFQVRDFGKFPGPIFR